MSVLQESGIQSRASSLCDLSTLGNECVGAGRIAGSRGSVVGAAIVPCTLD